MDRNFIIELAAEGEKKFEVDIPTAMPLGEAASRIKETMTELIGSSGDWEDKDGLKTLVALELEAWRAIFGKAVNVFEADGSGLKPLDTDGNAAKLISITQSGNQVMKHLYLQAKDRGDAVKLYLSFKASPGIQIQTSVDFG